MKLLTFLFILGSLSIGFVGGMAFISIINAENIKAIREQNRELRKELASIKKQRANTIEIIDNRAEPESYFTPF